MKRWILSIGLFVLAFIGHNMLFSQVSFSYDQKKCVDSTIKFSISGSNVSSSSYLFGTDVDIKNINYAYSLKNFDNVWSNPAHIKTVKDTLGNWYSFVVNYDGSIARYSYGSSIYYRPVTKNFGNLGGLLGYGATGVEIRYDQGNWYVFATSNSNLVRLDFGKSLGNTPTVNNISQSGKQYTGDEMAIFKEGNEWIGFVANYTGSAQLTRLDFGSSLNSTPTMTLLSFPGTVISNFEIVKDPTNGNFYIFYSGQTSLTLTRVEFGTNIKNNSPTYTSLGNPGNTLTSVARGLVFIKDCDQIIGWLTDENSQMIRLEFPNGLGSAPTATNLGSLSGKLKKSSFCSEPFCYNDSIYFHVINVGSDEFVQLGMPLLSGKTLSSVFNRGAQPALAKFNFVGTYKVRMVANLGEPNQMDNCISINVPVCCPKVLISKQKDTICPGFTSTVKVSVNPYKSNATYSWRLNYKPISGKIDSFIQASKTGLYTCVVSTGLCKDSVHFRLFVDTMIWNSQFDTSVCPESTVSYNITGNVSQVLWSPSQYLSDPNSKTVTIWPGSSTLYTLYVKNVHNCLDTGKVNITVIKVTKLNLPDTSIWCSGKKLVLRIQNKANYKYILWNGWIPSDSILVNTTGNYTCYVLDSNNCELRDTTAVKILNTPYLSKPKDTLFCKGLKWQYSLPSDPSQSYRVKGVSRPPGFVYVTNITDKLWASSYNACGKDSFTTMVVKDSVNNFNPIDTFACKNARLILQLPLNYRTQWKPGYGLSDSTIQNPEIIVVKDIVYKVNEETKNGCKDSSFVVIHEHDPDVLNISNTMDFCTNYDHTIRLNLPNSQVYWNGTKGGDSFVVNKNQLIRIQTINKYKCVATDSSYVTLSSPPSGYTDTAVNICRDMYYRRSLTGALNDVFYVNGYIHSPKLDLVLVDSGITTIVVKNACGSDTFYITARTVDCYACRYFLPNAFTPNGDTKNEKLWLSTDCPIDKYSMKVLNRWGQKIFETANPNEGWDGYFMGNSVQAGVYMVFINFSYPSPWGYKTEIVNQTITVLK